MKKESVPVLFITFARPEYARKTFDAIKAAKPSKLYFYSDKAHSDKPDEIDRNNQIRDFVVKETDWECELKTFFRDENAGLYASMLGAIDWVFENETQAIILEEDIVPSLAFFDFCEQLLPKFKDDFRVYYLSGTNLFENYNPNGYDYIFTRRGYYYGFATWKSRWQKVERKNIPFEEMNRYDINRFYGLTKQQTNYLNESEEEAYRFLQTNGSNPCWDYALGFTLKKEGAFGIIPVKNLVKNIGVSGIHSSGAISIAHNLNTSTSDKYIINNPPPFVIPDFKYDKHHVEIFYNKRLFHNRVSVRISLTFNRLFKVFGFSKTR